MSKNWTGADKFCGVLIAAMLTVIVGCQKEVVVPAGDPIGTSQSGEEKKVAYFIGRDDAGTVSFNVYRWNGSCATGYGSITGQTAAYYNDITLISGQSYLRATNSSCTLNGTYYPMLHVQRGANNTSQTWGPWYLVKPNFGPSITVRKNLLVRVKHVPSVGNDTYNRNIVYNGTTNTWSTALAVATGRFQVQELVGPFDLCTLPH